MQNGRTCTLNYNSGIFGSPAWVKIGRVSSPSLTQGRPTTRKTYHDARTSKNATGLMDTGIEGTYVQRDAGTSDTVLDALFDSYYNETTWVVNQNRLEADTYR